MLFSNLSLIACKDREQRKVVQKDQADGGEGVVEEEGEEEGEASVPGVGGDSVSRDSLDEGLAGDDVDEGAMVEKGRLCLLMSLRCCGWVSL